jgi:hypothetical protein
MINHPFKIGDIVMYYFAESPRKDLHGKLARVSNTGFSLDDPAQPIISVEWFDRGLTTTTKWYTFVFKRINTPEEGADILSL